MIPMNKIGGVKAPETLTPRNPANQVSGGEGFGDILKSQISPPAGSTTTAVPQVVKGSPAQVSALKFSSHAIDRLKSRGISFDAETLKRIEGAVDKAAQKGSKESLVLTDDSALIVSVKNKTVITAMDRVAMKENVFTNIDSTVII